MLNISEQLPESMVIGFLESDDEYTVEIDLLVTIGVYSRKDTAVEALKRNFVEGIDFSGWSRKTSPGGRPSQSYVITSDCFKAMCMMAENEFGRQVRKYYLAIERKWKDSQRNSTQPQLAFDAQVRLEIDILDKVLSKANLDAKLISGVMLNHAGTRLPALKPAIEQSHSLLAASCESELLLTPTKIGEALGVSARKVNLLLLELGYQVKNLTKTSKDEPAYYPTEIGQPYASNTLATGRLYENGADNTTYQHLKWKRQVVEVLREQLVGID